MNKYEIEIPKYLKQREAIYPKQRRNQNTNITMKNV